MASPFSCIGMRQDGRREADRKRCNETGAERVAACKETAVATASTTARRRTGRACRRHVVGASGSESALSSAVVVSVALNNRLLHGDGGGSSGVCLSCTGLPVEFGSRVGVFGDVGVVGKVDHLYSTISSDLVRRRP